MLHGVSSGGTSVGPGLDEVVVKDVELVVLVDEVGLLDDVELDDEVVDVVELVDDEVGDMA